MSDEANRLTGRVARYARVGGSVGRVGAKMAAGRLFGVQTDNMAMAAEEGAGRA